MAGSPGAWEGGVPQFEVRDRLVVLRTGIVLDRDTPASSAHTLTKLGLGGRSAPATNG